MTSTLSTTTTKTKTTTTTFYLKCSNVDVVADADVEFDGRKSNNRKYPRKVDGCAQREKEKKRVAIETEIVGCLAIQFASRSTDPWN